MVAVREYFVLAHPSKTRAASHESQWGSPKKVHRAPTQHEAALFLSSQHFPSEWGLNDCNTQPCEICCVISRPPGLSQQNCVFVTKACVSMGRAFVNLIWPLNVHKLKVNLRSSFFLFAGISAAGSQTLRGAFKVTRECDLSLCASIYWRPLLVSRFSGQRWRPKVTPTLFTG